MQVSWYFRAVVHTLLVCGMTYHAVDVDSHLLPYSRNLYAELWRLLNGGDQDQPVNLFTIRHAVEHVHMVLANYFALPNVALGKLHVAPFAGIPLPHLNVVFASPSDPDHENNQTYVLDKDDEQAWPVGLQRKASVSDTRAFFDSLKHMTLIMSVQSHKPSIANPNDMTLQLRDYMRWKALFKYDFSTQGQMQLRMVVNRQLPTSTRIRPTPSPTDYVGRYMAAIALAGRNFVMVHVSGTCVIGVNITTIACFVHAWSEASVLVYVEPLSWIYALTSAAQWVALLRFLSFNPRTYILGLTLKRGAPQVVEFLIGVCPLFVGYVLCGTIMYGATVPRFAGMATTATTLFALANGDEIRDTFVSLPWHGQVYLYSYIVIFAYVVLMVCIGIMEDAFFTSAFPSLWKEKTLSEDEWTRVVDLIRAETMAKYPDIADKQGEILSHVHRQLF
ncbi:hypothetical protein H310_01456 [Aphanomyces invadans]|uniref:Polycystin cation channel PKD1/PKD2 domain-containing protein n=1 Tax=Aphanomyces invadans TaxID=157072 RepID=A0A024UTM6_9STRA|nr:hypothetical protein H310_01456 [Aphanomyces invadans]ETW08978.1 hypothetical protein H310_01456 [Aphanomyces invadans]|eukprot:XP_008862783.1 hypothetical protein H310_01456 [Aphanomyces invadans]